VLCIVQVLLPFYSRRGQSKGIYVCLVCLTLEEVGAFSIGCCTHGGRLKHSPVLILHPLERGLYRVHISPAGRQRVFAAPYRTVQCTVYIVSCLLIQGVFHVGHPAEAELLSGREWSCFLPLLLRNKFRGQAFSSPRLSKSGFLPSSCRISIEGWCFLPLH